VSQQEQLRGMLKQQMGQQPGLHAAFRDDGSNGAAISPSLHADASSGAQPAGIGGLGALAALFGPAGARAPGMHGSGAQHPGSSPANSGSAPGDAAESDVAAATHGPAGSVHADDATSRRSLCMAIDVSDQGLCDAKDVAGALSCVWVQEARCRL
jgi:hypothetical protein